MPKTSTNESEGGINNYDIDYIFNNTGVVDFGSSIVPNVNNTYNLGSSSYFWQVGYITSINTAQLNIPPSGPLIIKNHLLPDLDTTWDLGSSNFRFRNLYVSNLLFSQISGNTFTSTSGKLVITTPTINDPVEINRDLVPAIDNTYRVGTSALKWLAVYGTTFFTNSVDGGGQPIIFNGSLRPSINGSFFLGSSTRTFGQGYINALFNTTLNTGTVAANTGTNLILTTTSAGNVISVDRHVVPVGTGLTNLGSSTNRYATVFSNAVDVPTLAANTVSSTSGNLLITTPSGTDLITVDRNLVPSVTEGNDLGVSGQRWANIRGANVITNLIGNGASTLNFDSSVAPLADLTKSLGTPTNRFLDANIETVKDSTVASNSLTSLNHQDLLITTANNTHKITLTRTLLPTVDGTQDLGAAHLKFNNLHCNVINAPSFNVDTISTATSTDLTLTTQSSSHAVVTPRNFNPTVNNTQTLGTTSLRWNQAYATTVFTGTVSNSGSPMLFNGSLRPNSDNSFFLGSTGLRFQSGYIRQTYSDQWVETPIIRAGTATDLNLTTVTGGNNIVAQRNVLPSTTNTLNLGSSSVRWATVFATNLNVTTFALNSLSSVTGNLTLTTPSSSDNIILDRTSIPSLDNTYTLGSLTNRWLAVYAPTVFTDTINTGAGDLTVTGDILPSTDNTLTLGSSGQRFTAAHITTLNSTTVNVPTVQAPTSTDLTLTTVSIGNKIVTGRNVLPNVDNTLDLGALATRFANIYATNVNATSYNANTLSSVTGNLLLTAPLVGDTVTTNRDFTPTVNNTQKLGTSSLKWAQVHGTTGFFGTISNNNNWIITAGGLQPNNDNQHSLGDITKRYQRAYVINTFTDTIASTGTNNLLLTSPTSLQLITTDRSFLPTEDNSLLLGSSLKKWANIYGNYITADTFQAPPDQHLYLSCFSQNYSIRCQNNLNPDQNELFDFGSSALLWNNSYIGNMFTNTLRGAAGTITTYNSLVPVTNNAHNLGSPSFRYSTISGSTINTQSLQNQSGTEIQCNEDFNPAITVTQNLGSSTLRWNNTYTQNVYTGSLRELPSVSGIVTKGILYPETDAVDSLGSATKRYSWIRSLFLQTEQITSSTSLIQLFKNLIPSGTIDLGSVANPFANLFSNSINVSYIRETSPGSNIVSVGSIVPDSTLTSSLGTSASRWLNGYIRNIFAISISTIENGVDLILSTVDSSRKIIAERSFVPYVDNALSLGSSFQRWLYGWFENVLTNNIYASFGAFITLHANINPTTTNSLDLGNPNFFRKIFSYNFVSPAWQNRERLYFGPATINTTLQKRNVFIGGGGVYWNGNYQFKFPTKGYYIFHLNVKGDTELLQQNYVQIQLYHVNTSNYLACEQWHHVGGFGNQQRDSFDFHYECNDTNDVIEIHMGATYNTVTNYEILPLSHIVRILTYP